MENEIPNAKMTLIQNEKREEKKNNKLYEENHWTRNQFALHQFLPF